MLVGRVTVAVVGGGRPVVEVLLKVTGSEEVEVAELVIDAEVDDDEGAVAVDAVLLVIELVAVADKDVTVDGEVLEDTGLEVVVLIDDSS